MAGGRSHGGLPIGCGGVAVYPGDIIVGDVDGIVVIPQHLAEEIALDSSEQERMEEWIMSEIKRGRPLPGLYPMNEETKARYEAWKKRS